MQTRRKLIAAALLLAVLATTLAWHFKTEARKAKEELNRVARDLAEAANQSQRLKVQVADVTASLQKFRSESTPSGQKPSTKTMRQAPDWLALLETDPKVQNRYLAYERSQLMMEYEPFYRMLGLSPEQIAKFEDNEMRHRGETIDVRSAAADQKLSPNDPAFAGILQQQEAAYEAAQKNLLGDGGYQQLQDYERDFSARAVVTNWAGAAVVAGLPLTSDQIAQLSTLVIQAARPSAAQPQAYIGNVDWNNINAQASSFLTPAQLEFIKSGDVIGPTGRGGPYQTKLNDLISQGDDEDQAKGIRAATVGQ